MLSAILEFAGLALVVVGAGVVLAHSADQIAEITKLGKLLVGSILLAGATSLPELTVDITAIRLGFTNLATGDLLGSSLMNLLILAVLDFRFESRGKMLSREAAGHALSGMMSMTLTALVCLAILSSRSVNWPSLLGLSVPTWSILLAYVFGVRMVFLDQRISVRAAAEADQLPEPSKVPLWKPALYFGGATVVLIIAGPRMAEAAARLADLTGLGKTFVGTTLVAFSTSLPELVSTLAALRLGSVDLAIGNIFGSNTFNMVLFAPLDALYSGSLFANVSPSHVITGLAVIVATATAIMGQLYRVERRTRLLEPDATLMLIVLGAALFLVYRLSTES